MPDIRPELSKHNKYWVERHRYYELKHFCLQYPLWKFYSKTIDGLEGKKFPVGKPGSNFSDPVLWAVERREEYANKMILLQDAVMATSPEFSDYIFRAVTQGLKYENLRLMDQVPCGREYWYELYRKFFYILDRSRK